MDTSSQNSKISKNTFLLYLRMLLLMGVSLYTSRVILATLGFEDYGLYNVVGGIVTMFTFLSSAMGSASQRYITFALGTNEEQEIKAVFNTTCLVHWILALVILLLSATIGLWFFYNKLVIPMERLTAAFWVYVFSIFSCMVSVISIPYNSLVIAHEKMGFFSFFSVLYACVKLGIVFLIDRISYDHLILYAGLLLVAQISERLAYQLYCKEKFPEARKINLKKTVHVKEMLQFAGWSMLPNLATVCYSQGINILLNLFFGPVVNAARGISVQIQGIVKNFISNFQTAISPQIIKSYATNDHTRLMNLIFKSSRFSYYLFLCMALPIFLEMDFLLEVWLKNVPAHTSAFARLIILAIVLDPLANPLCVANNATGKVKFFKIWESVICISVIPIGLFFLKLGYSPEIVFVVQIILSIVVQIVRVAISKRTLFFSYTDYIKNVLWYIIIVSVISSIVPIVLKSQLTDSAYSFLIVVSSSILSVLVTSYAIGLTSTERKTINRKVLSYIKKNK